MRVATSPRGGGGSLAQPMQPPLRGLLPVVEAGAEEPVASAGLVLDAVVVAHVANAGVARWPSPPFLGEALRSLGAAHAAQTPPPAEENRRIVGNGRLIARVSAGGFVQHLAAAT